MGAGRSLQIRVYRFNETILRGRLPMRMFTFDPADYAEAYATKGFVHIKSGLTREYLQSVIQAAEENMKAEQLMKQFAIGDKQQAKYELPSTDHYEELRQTVGRVMGAEPNDLILSE